MIDSPAIALTEIQERALSTLPIGIAQALLRLRDRVLARFPDEITHFILYGSFARGEAHAESDVDVMIVTTWPVKKLTNGQYESWHRDPRWIEIIDMSTDAMLECGRFVSVYVLPKTIFDRDSEVAVEAQREGIEMLNAQLRDAQLIMSGFNHRTFRETTRDYETGESSDLSRPSFWLSLADEELVVAQDNARLSHYARVISMAYYAMLYAAKAALLSIGMKVKSHAGAISEFSKHFAVSGRIDKSYSAMLARASRQRIHSDYAPYPRATREEADEAIRNAEAFIAKARELVEEELSR
jgi:uncharacterized protein (UPF0332 family)/predicted nucleotidyltransferase